MSGRASSGDAPRVAFRTLGCKVNRVESDSAAAALLSAGMEIVSEDRAQVVVVNTCTVTGEADAKARKAVRRALKAPGAPIVVVTGCLAALDADGLRALGERVVVTADKNALAATVADLLGRRVDPYPPSGPIRSGSAFRTRAMLKVEDGCDNFCTYCIVPHARGNPRGVALSAVLAEAAGLVASGVREIVLTGINIGRYRDAETGADLAALIEGVAAVGVERVRLSSIEPPDLDDRLLSVLGGLPSVCPQLHVPLQSGSDAVLSAMNRSYTAAEYAERVAAARDAIPGLALTSDVIAGFPTETDEQHAQTCALAELVGFSRLHVFRYSARVGTPAATLEQHRPEVIAARAQELRELSDALHDRYLASTLPRDEEVLVETVDGKTVTGTTRDYLRVRLPLSDARPGDVRRCRITAAYVAAGRRR